MVKTKKKQNKMYILCLFCAIHIGVRNYVCMLHEHEIDCGKRNEN